MIRSFLLALLMVSMILPAFSQQEKVVMKLAQDPASLLKNYKFYIQEVEDQRLIPGSTLGKVVLYGKDVPATLPGKADKELFNYWSFAAPKKEQTYLPLYISVKELSLNEKRVAPNKVTGEVKLSVKFRWYRNMQPVELTNYQTAANYTRPEREYDYEKLVKQLLDQSLAHFQKWMTLNAGKNPALARNIQLVFKEIVNNDPDTVFYSPKRPLIWDDFKVRNAKPGSRYAAAVFTSFGYEGRSYPKDDDLVVEIGLKTFMVKSMSWGRPESRNAGTLRHEQIHFDITRLVVEKFKARLLKADLTIEDYDSEIQYQFLEAFREMNRDQERYDGETGHGLNAGAQAAWDRKIAGEISAVYSVQ
ncbi:hypothetical protein MUK70_07325 [Dyadobacter chenwenxiniae]|uniref:DUF922 domain-containing protein n=1 Tax=Dyadobacter chenwenxiniae TaxID=2906456 RepID=A0A9X1PMA5_9BACT|nr:hypothetical protein [Dyadobacter chenwenxiniae]MCF0063035.1 hypothetical protein [Dyadobacter chenwenxiniae]UON84792.1 hypothetical protein MUK70_07325 [Dyadobacter chenwenxiniae]